MPNKEKSLEQGDCVVCYRHAEIYSIGECDHPVCHECSTRMRVLCSTNECPICRKELSLVIFKMSISPFSSIRYQNMKCERRYNIYFETDDLMKAYDELLEHCCILCLPKQRFKNFLNLKDHMRKVHERYYCDLCNENLKIFSLEKRSYTRQQLGHHRRKGDEDDKSHRGHPLCEFCDERFMDKDMLFSHLRRDHYYCHFCDADGKHQFFNDYDALRQHFKSDHCLCEEGECLEERFTSVFRTKIDLQAHKAQRHCQSASKSEARQARTVEIAFNVNRHPTAHFVPRGRGGGGPPPGRNVRSGRRDLQDFEDQVSAAGALPPSSHISKQQAVDINCVQDFPSLGGKGGGSVASMDENAPSSGGSSNKSIAQKLAHQNRFTIRTTKGKTLNDEDFPSLGASSGVSVNSSSTFHSFDQTSPTTSLHFSLNTKKNNGLNSSLKDNTSANVSIKYSCSKPAQMDNPPISTSKQPYKDSKMKAQVGSISHSGNITFKNNFPNIDKTSSEEFPSLVPVQNSDIVARWVVPQPSAPLPKPTKVKKEASSKNEEVCKTPKEMFVEKDFPTLVPTSQSQKQMLNYSGRSSLTIPVKSTAVKNDQTKLPCDSDENSGKNKKKKKALNKNSSFDVKNISADQPQTNSTKPKKKTVHVNPFADEDGPQEDLSWRRLGDYESVLPQQSSNLQSVTRDDSSHTKKSELQIGMLQAPKLNSKDFPSLGGLREGKSDAKENKGPVTSSWGSPQSKTKKRAAVSNANNKAGSGISNFPDTNMTFTSSSGQKFSIPAGDGSQKPPQSPLTDFSNKAKSAYSLEFTLPPNFEQRNKELINTINDVCEGNAEKFGKFKHLAELFRSNEISGHEYYKHCRQVIGKGIFHCILPELLALLPDIAKQQGVLEAYKKMDGGKGCSTSFAVCAGCQQVLIPEDFSHHMDCCQC